MIVVGLTGSLASGKSEAAKMFQNLGAKVFDADQSAKKVMLKGYSKNVLKRIRNTRNKLTFKEVHTKRP